MIGIYNETTEKLDIKNLNGKVSRLGKTKVYNRFGKDTFRSVGLVVNNGVFKDKIDEVDQLLSKEYCNMFDVSTLSDINTAVIFSQKDNNPYVAVAKRTTGVKDVLLISLRLQGKKIIDVYGVNCFNLEGYVWGGELTVIASLNNFDKELLIKLFDNETNEMVVYTFGRNEKECRFELDISRTEVSGEELTKCKSISFRFNKFRPARPTHTVLVYGKDREQLSKIVNMDDNRHNIVVISKSCDINQAIKDLASNNVSAVTLFVNTDKIEDIDKKIYGDAMLNLQSNFKTYFEMLRNGSIIKVQY